MFETICIIVMIALVAVGIGPGLMMAFVAGWVHSEYPEWRR